MLKISSWWFHPSLVIIFADYALHDNCICLWISHRMQMLMWPIAFLSCLCYWPCVKPCVCCTAPCPPRGMESRGQPMVVVLPLQLGRGRVGHAAVHPCLPVLGHVELELYKQWLNFPGDACLQYNLSASNLMCKCFEFYLYTFIFEYQATSLAFLSRRQLYLLSTTGRSMSTFCRLTCFLKRYI